MSELDEQIAAIESRVVGSFSTGHAIVGVPRPGEWTTPFADYLTMMAHSCTVGCDPDQRLLAQAAADRASACRAVRTEMERILGRSLAHERMVVI